MKISISLFIILSYLFNLSSQPEDPTYLIGKWQKGYSYSKTGFPRIAACKDTTLWSVEFKSDGTFVKNSKEWNIVNGTVIPHGKWTFEKGKLTLIHLE